MAEFGENLKRIREEKGMTQQTLADYLFVTRQAVSRWEGGSRYPDLMTAKKMSQFLEVSLDELLADEDMKKYAEKNAILESPISKKVQTAIMSFVFMCYLIMSIWTILEFSQIYESSVGGIWQIVMDVGNIVMRIGLMCALGYGMVTSICDCMSGKVVALISIFFFGNDFWSELLSIMSLPGWGWLGKYVLILSTIISLAIILVFIKYFYRDKIQRPRLVYLISGVYGIKYIVFAVTNVIYIKSTELLRYYYTVSTVNVLAVICILLLFCYMAHELYLKRKRAAL